MSYVIVNNSKTFRTRFMLPSGRWTRDLDEAQSFRSQRAAVRFGLRFVKTFFVLPAQETT